MLLQSNAFEKRQRSAERRSRASCPPFIRRSSGGGCLYFPVAAVRDSQIVWNWRRSVYEAERTGGAVGVPAGGRAGRGDSRRCGDRAGRAGRGDVSGEPAVRAESEDNAGFRRLCGRRRGGGARTGHASAGEIADQQSVFELCESYRAVL